jgi:hypothetical protein
MNVNNAVKEIVSPLPNQLSLFSDSVTILHEHLFIITNKKKIFKFYLISIFDSVMQLDVVAQRRSLFLPCPIGLFGIVTRVLSFRTLGIINQRFDFIYYIMVSIKTRMTRSSVLVDTIRIVDPMNHFGHLQRFADEYNCAK